jgi:hypothetical protein
MRWLAELMRTTAAPFSAGAARPGLFANSAHTTARRRVLTHVGSPAGGPPGGPPRQSSSFSGGDAGSSQPHPGHSSWLLVVAGLGVAVSGAAVAAAPAVLSTQTGLQWALEHVLNPRLPGRVEVAEAKIAWGGPNELVCVKVGQPHSCAACAARCPRALLRRPRSQLPRAPFCGRLAHRSTTRRAAALCCCI